MSPQVLLVFFCPRMKAVSPLRGRNDHATPRFVSMESFLYETAANVSGSVRYLSIFEIFWNGKQVAPKADEADGNWNCPGVVL